MRAFIIVVSLFALFFSAAGYVRVKHPTLFTNIQQLPVKKQTTAPSDTSPTANDIDNSQITTLSVAVYEDYNPEKLARANNAPVVLYFHATWCPSCISTDRILKKKITTLPTGTSVLKVDYDTAIDLKAQYDITYQHTFVQVDAQGVELARWSGGAIDGIAANLVIP